MTGMPQVQSIRRLRRNGESVASIARKTHAGELTVRKYLAKEDLSAVPSSGKPRASAVGPVSARDRAVARGESRELAQAAAYRDQDLGAVGGRAWRGGLHGDAGGGAARARVRGGA